MDVGVNMMVRYKCERAFTEFKRNINGLFLNKWKTLLKWRWAFIEFKRNMTGPFKSKKFSENESKLEELPPIA